MQHVMGEKWLFTHDTDWGHDLKTLPGYIGGSVEERGVGGGQIVFNNLMQSFVFSQSKI